MPRTPNVPRGYDEGFVAHLASLTLREPEVRDVKEYGDLGALEVLRTFRAIVLDADGVIWDGTETRSARWVREPDPAGDGWDRVEVANVSKSRDLRDGQGISFLRALGIRVLVASAESDLLAPLVAKLNGLPSYRSGAWPRVDVLTGLRGGKVEAITTWLANTQTDITPSISRNLQWDDVVYVGDDRTDLEVMRRARMVVVPSDAQRCAVRLAHVQLTKPGGRGAIRELAELVCDARGVDESSLADS